MTSWWLGGYGPDMEGSAPGISRMVSRSDGSLARVGTAADVASPSYLASAGDHLYAAAEGDGRVASFRVDGDVLHRDGSVASGGESPCHLGVIGGSVVASNYSGGQLGVVSLTRSGAVRELEQVLEGSGSGPHPAQDGPHAHATLAADDTTVVSADLGADRLYVHAVDGGSLTRTSELAMPAGSGPRDIAKHPSGLLYVVGEHSANLHVVEWTGARLELLTSAPLPGAQVGDQAAAVGFGSNGSVYVGLRGSNQISVLRASPDGREVTALGAVSSAGEWPRHLVVDGDVLHVCNQQSNTVASFLLSEDGLPQLISEPAFAPSPTHLLRA